MLSVAPLIRLLYVGSQMLRSSCMAALIQREITLLSRFKSIQSTESAMRASQSDNGLYSPVSYDAKAKY